MVSHQYDSNMINDLFFELIQVAIGTRKQLSHIPSTTEWEQLYRLADKQTVLGICFKAVRTMSTSVPRPLYMKWLAVSVRIQQRNDLLNKRCKEVYEAVVQAGFECAILKGQGLAEQYVENPSIEEKGIVQGVHPLSPSPSSSLNLLRQSGDIDIWLWKNGVSKNENKKEVVRFAHTINPKATYTNHHVGIEWMGVDVELHYAPSYFCNPFFNRRLHKWFSLYDKSHFHHSFWGFTIPDKEFNKVFLLTHAFRHYLSGGLGLRQVMDYYFVVHKDCRDNKNTAKNFNSTQNMILKELGIHRFEKAMNWVAGYVFEGKDCKDGRKHGEILLEHILNVGNFGKYKNRTTFSKYTHLGRFINQLSHDLLLISYYPNEAIWVPLRMIWVFIKIRIKRWTKPERPT